MHNLDSIRTPFVLSSLAQRIVPLGSESNPSTPLVPSSMRETMPVPIAFDGDAAMAQGEPLCEAPGPRLVRLCYGKQPALDSDPAMVRKLPAHLDVTGIQVEGPYGLHTEFAGKPRSFDSPLLDGLNTLKTSHRRGVPELWSSQLWSEELTQFIIRLVGTSAPPKVIEVHPPFISTASTIEDFLGTYGVFEAILRDRYPACEFLLENRSGSKHPSPFLISSIDSIVALGHALATRSLNLQLAVDLPQVYTAHWGSMHQVGMEGLDLMQRLRPIHRQIRALHLWGRGPNGGAHSGDLDRLFVPGSGAKEACLTELRQMLDDGGPDRHLVLEVTRQGDAEAILADLRDAGFQVQ